MSTLRMFIAGPVDVDDEVLDVMSKPILPHFGPDWMPIFNSTTRILQELYGTKNDIIIMPGPGTVALDSAIGSLVSSGSTICIPCNGFFGERLRDIALAYDLHPLVINYPLGQPIDPQQVRETIRKSIDGANSAGRPIRALAVVHHETSTGILNPIKEICQVAQEYGLSIIVDAVGSMGGTKVPVDEWGIDVCVSVPNKCLCAPPGVAIMSISKEAWRLAQKNPMKHGWYSDLRTWAWYKENSTFFPYPSTLPTSIIAALKLAVESILSSGIEKHWESHIVAAQRVRNHLSEDGFKLFPMVEFAAPMLSVFDVDPAIDIQAMINYLMSREKILISGGLGELRGHVIRIGHMGRAKNPENVKALLNGIDNYLKLSSIK